MSVGELCNLPELQQPNEEVLQFLGQVKIFKELPQELLPVLAAISQQRSFEPGTDIIRQGDIGNEFFVIMEGKAKVTIDGNLEALFQKGDFFGERALLKDEARNATVTAEEKALLLSISRDMFQQLGLHQRLRFDRRKAVGRAEGEGEKKTKPPSEKTEADRAFLKQAMRANENLSTIVSTLDDAALELIINVMWKEDVPAGKALISEGAHKADYFYVVQTGAFEYTQKEKVQAVNVNAAMARAQNVGNCKPGGSFGELALLYMAPRACTVTATEASVVWIIDRGNFKGILNKHAENIALDYIKYLDKVEVFSPLQVEEKQALAKALREMVFSKDENILNQGEDGDTFYILIDGVVDVIQDGAKVNQLTATADKACFFGERALLENEKRNATIRVVSEGAQTLVVDRDSVDLILGPLQALQARGKTGKSVVLPKGKLRTTQRQGTIKEEILRQGDKFGLIKFKDLTTLGLLGNGGFGSVTLVEHAVTKNTYALKMLSKGFVAQSGMQNSVIMEKDIQLMCDSPFIVRLHETFNDDQNLWFLLDAALGGELYATYSRKGFHGRVKHAQFYIAGVVQSFEYLHSIKVVYRDLKPENLLLNDKGHVKLTDMGLAKVIVGKTFTTCGTPDYFAPELVDQKGHTHAVDWWTLGILTFELMTGHPPFESATPMQIYRKVTQGINAIRFPRNVKGVIEDLVKHLCHKTPSKRLPMKAGGTENIKKHPWLEKFDWKGFADLTMQPPFLPEVKSKRDLANFDARAGDAPPQIKYKDDGSGWDAGFATSA